MAESIDTARQKCIQSLGLAYAKLLELGRARS